MIEFKNHKSLKDLDSVSLAARLRDHFVQSYPLSQVQRLDDAIQVASYLHRSDVRRGKRGKMPNPPYIEHPLRVALRLVDFRVTNPDIYLAAVLHDTVEDHPFEFSEFSGVYRSNSTDEPNARYRALDFISTRFGYGTAAIVEDVSNPILPHGISKAEKVEAYHAHVTNTIKASAEGRILKFSDFVDNAGSLHHHYEYDDPKVKYFIDRYSPLLKLYAHSFEFDSRATAYDPSKALARLSAVEDEFTKFREALDKREDAA